MSRSIAWIFGVLLLVVLMSLMASFSESQEQGADELYRNFKDPPWEYTVRPYWFWNGKLDPVKLRQQMDLMMEQGVYGAIFFPFMGLETPYLSEDWFSAVKVVVEKARRSGFLLGFADEYNWPSGEARDIWSKNILQSRVLEADPSVRMKSFACTETVVRGPRTVDLELPARPEVVVVGHRLSASSLDYNSLQDLTSHWSNGRWGWEVPEGEWSIFVFTLKDAQGIDGGRIDPMNPRAIELFLKFVYEEYYRRFGNDFGKSIQLAVTDTEGDYGERLAWTPRLFSTFQQEKGYDLRPYLPALFRDSGPKTDKVRCDYLDVITKLYSKTFVQTVTDWCEAHGIKHLGSFWEESLKLQTDAMGDFFSVYRATSLPETDGLFEAGRNPRDYKEARTVALVKGSRFAVENQAVQGNRSFLSPQRMRLVTNMFANWGANLFIPHAFNYDPQRITYHADWFYHQPFFKYFKYYADYIRRISYMNSEGRHVAEIAILCPIESVWANSEPLFNITRPEIPWRAWGNFADDIDNAYSNLMVGLVRAGWDFDPIDAQYLLESRLTGNQLELAGQRYSVLILPPMTTIRRSAMAKVKAFYEAGGKVIALEQMPEASVEEGRGDPELRRLIGAMFGTSPVPGSPRENRQGGRAYLVRGDFFRPEVSRYREFLFADLGGKEFDYDVDLSPILSILDRELQRDVTVIEGEARNFYFLHRRKLNTDFYWVVNDSSQGRTLTVKFRTRGVPFRWDAATGREEPLWFCSQQDGTEVRLRFGAWDAFYVVFRPSASVSEGVSVRRTNFEPIQVVRKEGDSVVLRAWLPAVEKEALGEVYMDNRRYYVRQAFTPLPPVDLGLQWKFTPQASIPVAYARRAEDLNELGEQQGWAQPEFNDQLWEETWLSPERFSARDWWVIGPFPNEDHRGYVETFPPETTFNLQAAYEGISGQRIRWQRYTASTYFIDLNDVLAARTLRWAVGYLATRVYSPVIREATLIVAADNAKAWLNGEQVLAFHTFPYYREMRDFWAHRAVVSLRAGWNQLLVKVEKDRGDFRAMVRIANPDGSVLRDVIYQADGKLMPQGSRTIWYRLTAPPGASALKLPQLRHPARVFVNGRQVAQGDGRISLAAVNGVRPPVIVLALDSGDDLTAPLEFIPGTTGISLGSWTGTGLSYFAGSATYETEFDLESAYLQHRLELDLGEVGVVAEAWLNERPLGVRVWKPFAFDITSAVRRGRNRLKVLVTNTMAGERAVGDRAQYLKNIDLNGLLGPVRVLVYREVELTAVANLRSR